MLPRSCMLHQVRIIMPGFPFDCAGIGRQSEGSARKRRCVSGGTSSADLSGQSKPAATHVDLDVLQSKTNRVQAYCLDLRSLKTIQRLRRTKFLRMASWLLWSLRYHIRTPSCTQCSTLICVFTRSRNPRHLNNQEPLLLQVRR